MHCNGMSTRIKLAFSASRAYHSSSYFGQSTKCTFILCGRFGKKVIQAVSVFSCCDLTWQIMATFCRNKNGAFTSFSYHVFNPRALIFGIITYSLNTLGELSIRHKSPQTHVAKLATTDTFWHWLSSPDTTTDNHCTVLSGGMFECCASLGCSILTYGGIWVRPGLETSRTPNRHNPADTSLWKPLVCPCFAI